MKIARHTFETNNPQQRCEHYSNLLQLSLSNIHKSPANLGTLASDALSYAAYVSVLNPNSIELYRALRIAAYSLTEVCILAKLPEGSYEVFVGEGEPVMIPSGVTSYSSGISWLKGFYLAAACREAHLNDSLSQIPVEILKQSSTRSDEYLYLQIEALQSFWKRQADTPQRVIEAMKATDPEQVKLGTVDAALNLGVPQIDLLYRLIEKDDAAFNDALVKALQWHKKHWGKNSYKNDPHGFFALGPLGLSAIAYERGINIEVESDYIPKYIVQRDFLK